MASGQTYAQRFPQSRPLEAQIDQAVSDARARGQHDVSISAAPGAEQIRGEFLRWLLLDAIPEPSLAIKRIALCNVTIVGAVDLAAAKLDFLPRFLGCTFDGEITLVNAEIIGFDLISSRAAGIMADRLTAKGSLEIRAGREGEPASGPAVIVGRLRLNGAKIRGNLNLRGSRLIGQVAGDGDRISVFADGLSVDSNVLLSGGTISTGEIRLNGATIQRNLDCSGARLVNHRGFSLSAAGARISGTVYLCHTQRWAGDDDCVPFVSEGCVRLEGAKIIGDFDCSGGHFTAGAFGLHDFQPGPGVNDLLYAIKASGLDVGAGVDFASEPDSPERFMVKGAIELINARVGGDFDCEGALFDFPGEEPLAADGITVTGKTSLTGLTTNGILRFAKANLKQGCYATELTFETDTPCHNLLREPNLARQALGTDACGIYAPGAEVGATFFWSEIRKRPDNAPGHYPLWLYLFGAKANAVEDDEQSWSIVDRFDVTGCQYSSISSINGDASWRLEHLDRQYALCLSQCRHRLAGRARGALARAHLVHQASSARCGDRAVQAATLHPARTDVPRRRIRKGSQQGPDPARAQQDALQRLRILPADLALAARRRHSLRSLAVPPDRHSRGVAGLQRRVLRARLPRGADRQREGAAEGGARRDPARAAPDLQRVDLCGRHLGADRGFQPKEKLDGRAAERAIDGTADAFGLAACRGAGMGKPARLGRADPDRVQYFLRLADDDAVCGRRVGTAADRAGGLRAGFLLRRESFARPQIALQ